MLGTPRQVLPKATCCWTARESSWLLILTQLTYLSAKVAVGFKWMARPALRDNLAPSLSKAMAVTAMSLMLTLTILARETALAIGLRMLMVAAKLSAYKLS